MYAAQLWLKTCVWPEHVLQSPPHSEGVYSIKNTIILAHDIIRHTCGWVRLLTSLVESHDSLYRISTRRGDARTPNENKSQHRLRKKGAIYSWQNRPTRKCGRCHVWWIQNKASHMKLATRRDCSKKTHRNGCALHQASLWMSWCCVKGNNHLNLSYVLIKLSRCGWLSDSALSREFRSPNWYSTRRKQRHRKA